MQILDSLKSYFSQIAADTVFRILGAVLVVAVGFWITNKLIRLLRKTVFFTKMDINGAVLIRTIISILLKTLVIFTAAAILGIPTTSIITIVGSLGLATGLALQGSLTNLAGGILIIAFKSFKIGDFIETASGDSGTVIDIGVFYTTIQTIDNTAIVLPNGTLSNQAVKNITAFSTRRLEMKLTVGYDSDVSLVKRVLEETLRANSLVLQEQEIFIRLNSIENGVMQFVVRAWFKIEDYWPAFYELNESIKAAFDKNGIVVPLPQMDLHLREKM